jgi:hypothetical protein
MTRIFEIAQNMPFDKIYDTFENTVKPIIAKQCVGCGICEAKFPVLGKSAIYATVSENQAPGIISCCYREVKLKA